MVRSGVYFREPYTRHDPVQREPVFLWRNSYPGVGGGASSKLRPPRSLFFHKRRSTLPWNTTRNRPMYAGFRDGREQSAFAEAAQKSEQWSEVWTRHWRGRRLFPSPSPDSFLSKSESRVSIQVRTPKCRLVVFWVRVPAPIGFTRSSWSCTRALTMPSVVFDKETFFKRLKLLYSFWKVITNDSFDTVVR